MSIIVLVSELCAPLGMPPGGPNYAAYLVFFEICIFGENVVKNQIFKNCIGIWTLGASGDASWRAKLCGLSCVF